jgi:NAD(P)-dependent dehydrogenase (short-subunit alcohol dehydrogenase family)
LGSTANYRCCDVSKEGECKEIVEECVKLYGRIDILVLSAGVNAHTYFEDMKDLDVLRRIMDVNFFGYVYCTRFALPHLRKSSGQVVVLSSISGEIGLPYRVPYCSSKFAVTGFFEALRTELDQFNVAITIVCPPAVATEMRSNDLLGRHFDTTNKDDRMSTQAAVSIIMDAADRRARKVYTHIHSFHRSSSHSWRTLQSTSDPYSQTTLTGD